MLPPHAIALDTTNIATGVDRALSLEGDIVYLSKRYRVDHDTVVAHIDALIESRGYRHVLDTNGRIHDRALALVAGELARLGLERVAAHDSDNRPAS